MDERLAALIEEAKRIEATLSPPKLTKEQKKALRAKLRELRRQIADCAIGNKPA